MTKLNTKTEELRNALVLVILFLALAFLILPEFAIAQGQGQAVLDYTYEEYARPMLNMAVVAAALTMFFLRFSFPVIGMVAAGGMTLANYQAIAGLFGA
mgnify:CR=1 FL=1